MLGLILGVFGFISAAYLLFTPFEKVDQRFPHVGFKAPYGTKILGVMFIIASIGAIYLRDYI